MVEAGSPGRLRGCHGCPGRVLTLQNPQRARISALHPQTQPGDACPSPCGERRLRDVLGVGLHGHLGAVGHPEALTQSRQQGCEVVRWQQRRGTAADEH